MFGVICKKAGTANITINYKFTSKTFPVEAMDYSLMLYNSAGEKVEAYSMLNLKVGRARL